jgi:undecaprenyl-diphosphatase
MRWFTYFGLDQIVVPVVVLLVVSRYTRRVGFQAFVAYALAGPAALAIKMQCPRLRPGYPGNGVIVAPDESLYLSSFPSGHTAIAFALAFTLLLSFPGPRRIPIGVGAVALATMVGVSRIYRGIHWPTDVLGGIAVAWLAALVAWWLFSRGQATESQHPAEGPA